MQTTLACTVWQPEHAQTSCSQHSHFKTWRQQAYCTTQCCAVPVSVQQRSSPPDLCCSAGKHSACLYTAGQAAPSCKVEGRPAPASIALRLLPCQLLESRECSRRVDGCHRPTMPKKADTPSHVQYAAPDQGCGEHWYSVCSLLGTKVS